MAVHLFGIRHHGPGCARSLLSALETLEPDAILIEGPPDAEQLLTFLASQELVPPVALLVYPTDDPQRGVFYPFAIFSPEWQALQYGTKRSIPVRFMDLPLRNRLAMEKTRVDALAKAIEEAKNATPEAVEIIDDKPLDEAVSDETKLEEELTEDVALDDDPLGMLAMAAGYSDRELWWEHQIEQRIDPAGLFEGIAEAMTELRAARESASGYRARDFEPEREAAMRETIRKAEREGFGRIAVVCGAWHVPALAKRERSTSDANLLKSLHKEKVDATWTPWTYSRLSYQSGYGAGVRSPGWYEHLWKTPRTAALRWVATAARLMREEDIDASSATVIEAVRLGEALAAMRGLPLVGHAELNDAMLATLCNGNPAPLRLIRERLEIGERLGTVPSDAPSVPLQRDLEALQKSLRLKPTTEIKPLDLDLRNETDRNRSRLLHRLRLMQILWGEPTETRGKSGSFHELWQLKWQVEFVVRLIEMSVWGTTVERAASGFAIDRAEKTNELPALTSLLAEVLVADLPLALEHILARLQAVAAVSADVRHLANALPPLARVARYSDVRKVDTERLRPIISGFFERIVVGLPLACRSIDEDAAFEIASSIDNVQQSLELLEFDVLHEEWLSLLASLMDDDAAHALIRGLACRQLLEASKIDDDELHRRTRLELSPVSPPLQATSWLQGMLRGSGLLVVHRDALWQALDRWLVELSAETFDEILPLVRRAFANFTQPERRTMGEKVKNLKASEQSSAGKRVAVETRVDMDRAARVLPILARILGVAR